MNIFWKRTFLLLPGIESRFHGRPGHRLGPWVSLAAVRGPEAAVRGPETSLEEYEIY